MNRALDWLRPHYLKPVWVKRDGQMQMVAALYRLEREGKASVWYVATKDSIKRICV